MAKIQKKVKKIKKKISHVIINIHSTYNNTIISITDIKGNVVAWQSAGTIGYKGTKKSTPYAAKIALEKCLELVKDVGIQKIDIKTRGIGPGRGSCIKALQDTSYEINSIKDRTPVPFNGCRLKKRLRNKIK